MRTLSSSDGTLLIPVRSPSVSLQFNHRLNSTKEPPLTPISVLSNNSDKLLLFSDIVPQLNLATNMAGFGNYLFEKTRRILAPSHNLFAHHPLLATFLLLAAFVVSGVFIGVVIAMKKIVFIPLIVAITAAFLSALSPWIWIYVSTPLTALNAVVVFLILLIVYFAPSYGAISHSACQTLMICWAPIALPGWYFCACFFDTGSRLIANRARNQNAGQAQDVELGTMRPSNYDGDAPTGLRQPPPIHATGPTAVEESI